MATDPPAAALREALLAVNDDWHPVSTRPCPTCDPISMLIGVPFGCTRYRRDFPGQYHTDEPRWPRPALDDPASYATLREAAAAVDAFWDEPDAGSEDARDGLIWMHHDERAVAGALRALRLAVMKVADR